MTGSAVPAMDVCSRRQNGEGLGEGTWRGWAGLKAGGFMLGQKKAHFLEGFWLFRVLGGLGAVLGLTFGRLGPSWANVW